MSPESFKRKLTSLPIQHEKLPSDATRGLAIRRMVFNIMGIIVVSLLLIRFPFAQGSGIVLQDADKSISSESERRLALLIGNSAYVHGGNLRNAVNDVRDVKAALEGLGFRVIKHENCTQRSMKEVIDDFGEKLRGYQVGLFFYAGHGVQVGGENYLIPVDAKLQSEKVVEYDCVRADRVLAMMEGAGSKTNIVILDACRDNPFERSWRRGGAGRGLAFMNAPSGALIAYATAPGSTALDGTGRNGVYTAALLDHVKTAGITIEQMFKRVRVTVEDRTNKSQTPWESTSLRGDFYFVRGGVPASVAETLAPTPMPDPLAEVKTEFEREKHELARQEEDRKKLEKERKELATLKTQEEEKRRLEEERRKAEREKSEEKKQQIALGQKPPLTEHRKSFADSLGMKFVYIVPGTFMMGSPANEPERKNDESQYQVMLTKGFFMGSTEVTVGQWRSFVSETGYKSEAEKGDGAFIYTGTKGGNWKFEKKTGHYWEKSGFPQTDEHPVTCVSWNDAQAFIKWLNTKGDGKYRLPTEAEWEYACRAGTNTPRYWGDSLDDSCRFANAWNREANEQFTGKWALLDCSDGFANTSPAGKFTPNAWSLFDMIGNVWEWCEDWYGDYPTTALTDPAGSKTGSKRVARGLGWRNFPRYMRCASRDATVPEYRNNQIGFRVVRTE